MSALPIRPPGCPHTMPGPDTRALEFRSARDARRRRASLPALVLSRTGQAER